MAESVPALDVHELARMRAEGVPHALLDVREPDEVAVCALTGSLHIPMAEVLAHRDRLPPDRPLVVLCHHGMRSLQVAATLRQVGLADAWNLSGGIDAWAREVDTDMARY